MKQLKTICCIVLAAAATGCLASSAQAESIPDAMNRAVFEQSGDIYRNTGILRQATLLFGLSYPDLEAVNDSRSVNRIYQDLIRQRGGEPVRTRDLPNPFNSSLSENPSMR